MGGKKGSATAKSKPRKKTSQKAETARSKACAKTRAPVKATFVSLHDELTAFGLRVNTVMADGNCFFRAIADQVCGKEAAHHEVRLKVVQYMQKNPSSFSPFVEDDEGFEKYIGRMRKVKDDATWAGHMEVQAASLCYEANIHIYQSGQPTWRVINFHPTDSHRCLHLSYHDGEHYNSVRGATDPGDGPAESISLQPCNMENGKLQKPNAFGEQQVRKVSASTFCFNKEQVINALHECGGNVDDATELVVSQMGTVAKEEPSCATPRTTNNLAEPQLANVEHKFGAEVCSLTQRGIQKVGVTMTGPDPQFSAVFTRFQVDESGLQVTLQISLRVQAHGHTADPGSGAPALADTPATGPAAGRRLKQNRASTYRPSVSVSRKPANNKPCPCNSGRRYKQCCKAKHILMEARESSIPAMDSVSVQLKTLDI